MSTEVTTGRAAENQLVTARRAAPIMIASSGHAASTNPEGLDVSQLLHSARRRWTISLLPGLVLCALAAGATWTLQRTKYNAAAHLKIAANNPRLVFETAEGPSNFGIVKSTQQQLLLAPFVLGPALRNEEVSRLPIVQLQVDPVTWLQEHLQVTFPGDSEFMVVSLELEDRAAAVTIVNAVVDAYLSGIVNEERTEKTERLKSLEAARAAQAETVRQKYSELQEFNDVLGINNSEAMNIAQQNMMHYFAFWRSALSKAEVDLMEAQTELDLLEAMLNSPEGDDYQGPQSAEREVQDQHSPTLESPDVASAAVSDEELGLLVEADGKALGLQAEIDRINERIKQRAQRLVPQLAEAHNRSDRAELAELEGQLRNRKAVIRTVALERIQQEIDNRLRRSSSGLRLPDGVDEFQMQLVEKRNKVAILEKNRADFQRRLDALEKEIETMNLGRSSLEIEMKRLELEDAKETRRSVAAEIERTRIELNSSARIELLHPAKTASAPDNRKRLAMSGAAGMGGLLLPLFLLTLYDFRKRHVNDARSVVESLETMHLGSIPRVPPRLLKRGRTRDARRYEQWQDRLLESVDAIASLLTRNTRLEDNRIIQITSPAAGEGKSTVATQLARSLARSGHRTLLADFDLRRPTLHSAFGFDLQPGVAEVLNQSAELAETIRKTTHSHLDLLTAGCRQEKIFAASSIGRLESLFATLREQYEFVIVDSCPILPVVDSRVIGQHVDGVILSLVKDFSKLPQALKASEIMKSYGIRIIGTVVTGCHEEDQYYAEGRKYLT